MTEQRYKEEQRTRFDVTIEVLKSIANKILPFLDFTQEVSNGPQLPVSCLYTQLLYEGIQKSEPWYKHQKAVELQPGSLKDGETDTGHKGVKYKFYKKPVSNPVTILERSAITEESHILLKCYEKVEDNAEYSDGKRNQIGHKVYIDNI